MNLPELREAPRKERPILFSGPLVRAILEGRKTQTRRLIKDAEVIRRAVAGSPLGDIIGLCKYGQPGDRLWVRETWRTWERPDDGLDGIRFVADDSFRPIVNTREAADLWVVQHNAKSAARGTKWRPSIHMPRWASRITLEVTGVRVERLQAITQADALAEGVVDTSGAWGDLSDTDRAGPRGAFEALWNRINGAESWDANPWVWVVEFKRVEVPHV